MRIALVTIAYNSTIKSVYDSVPGLKDLSYSEQKKVIDKEISIWTSGWENALIKKGFEVLSIPVNVKPMQLKWAEENNFSSTDIHEITFKQINEFKPEILWYNYFDIPLIRKIKSNINSLKLILGWTGGTIVDMTVLKEVDLVLSCAPEAVVRLRNNGLNASHLNHAFNPLLLENIDTEKKVDKYNFVFIGQIFRGSDLHRKRETLLKKLAEEVDITIFSPMYELGSSAVVKSVLKRAGYYMIRPFTVFDSVKEAINNNLYLKEIMRSKGKNFLPYDPVFKEKINKPVYGTEMYRTINESLLVLNVHIDSSSEYASNMRLFETTGVGTCLLTDWKKNINDLFIEDKEVITYKSDSECVEKAKWLMSNRQKCLEIGKAGQAKTFSKHSYDSRAEDLMAIIEGEMGE